MDEPLEVGATFPAPPNLYKRYTVPNLSLLKKLHVHGPSALEDEPDVPEWLSELDPPRVDWVVEEGGYHSFGEFWPIPSREPTLAEVGLVQLYDPQARDLRPALHSLLRTLLHSYHTLLSTLLSGPQTHLGNLEAQAQAQAQALDSPVFMYTEWMRAAGVNMMHAVNRLRGMQARVGLEGVMRARVEERRRKVREIRGKCKSIEEELQKLRDRARRLTAARDQLVLHTAEAEEEPSKEPATIAHVAEWVAQV
ncbi:hypothetical protein DACRYDRAFT_118635 [Dacryopinax primogenitus]|uniref:Mediator of RNA polymerase II transcription subunit 7 n=1 Tax=Dacryopinax primogenitus (strain DJM 731) TaxID=1858805 RepID=M5FXT1_DACPD|nr:uncharacterized protein DACRYDRAFT_118635 [Dacryopinax primogenitus]EJT98336.1 hypothetical protein DACRYDRAFT_118635 [Dacryopinax primogenitus]